MGCHSSFPIEGAYDARLPVKPHVRNTYSAVSGPGRHTLQETGTVGMSATQQGTPAQHDVCILHSPTGSPWAQGLSEVLTTNHHLSVWCPADQQRLGPAWSRASATGGKAEEIRPARDNLRASGCADSVTVAQVVSAVSHSAQGLIVLVSAGSTWDELVLGCLRHSFIRERPLVLLHAPESCPAPNMSDWPADVQQMLMTRSTPMFTFIASYAQFGSQHVVSSLQQQSTQFTKQREAAQAAAAADMAAAAAEARGAVAAAGISAGDLQLSTQRSSMDSKQQTNSTCSIEPPVGDSSESLAGTSTDSRVGTSAGDGSNGRVGSKPDHALHGSGSARSAIHDAHAANPWAYMQQQLEILKRRSAAGQNMAAKLANISKRFADEEAAAAGHEAPSHAAPAGGTTNLGPLVLAAHHPNMLAPVLTVARALAPYIDVTVVDGSGCMLVERQARRTLHHMDRRRDVSASGAYPAGVPQPHPMVVPEQSERVFDATTTTTTHSAITKPQVINSSSITAAAAPYSSPESVSYTSVTVEMTPTLPKVASTADLDTSGSNHLFGTTLPSLPPLFTLPHMRIPSAATGVASSLLGQPGKLGGSRHSRSVSVGAGPFAFDAVQLYTPPAQAHSIQEEPLPCKVINCLSTEARTVVASCKHYVLFSGYNLGTASSLAGAEVQAALQANAQVHVVCEASFNLVTPDTRHWPLTPLQAAQLSSAWLSRLLWYPDHVDPFLAELASRLMHNSSHASHCSQSISSLGSSQHSSTLQVRSGLVSSTGPGASLGRTASELLGGPVVVDLCMRLSTSRPHTRTSLSSTTQLQSGSCTPALQP